MKRLYGHYLTFNRASGFSDYDSLLTRYAMRFFACLNMLKEYALPLLFSLRFCFCCSALPGRML